MKYRGISIKNVMESIVPITRFNRGEAGKVFEEVSQYGVKVVVKNNVPACVLVKPEQYDAMMEALEDYALYVEAQKREAAHAQASALSSDATKELLGISAEALDNIEVDLE
jgi:PHD/YefM family antitoxin component YafN of YafNO toxin-antitoxin module